ncbi:MAG: CBS domain-containing protein [Planctomycetaceae bacterium]
MAEQDTSSIMTPRTDMDCIHVDCSLEETRRQVVEAGHSRIPIIGESTDDIIGILYAKDLLKVPPRRRTVSLCENWFDNRSMFLRPQALTHYSKR